MKTIQVSDTVYDRLAKRITGFGDTPTSVVERLLDEVERIDSGLVKPTLKFYPEDEKRFKSLLLRDREAEVALFKKNGSVEILLWNASKLHETSNIRANIWSGYLRNWEKKGIVRADFSIYEKPIDHFKDLSFFNLCKQLSVIINVQYSMLISFDFEHQFEYVDGENQLVLQFADGQNYDLLENNEFFDSFTKRIVIPQHCTSFPF